MKASNLENFHKYVFELKKSFYSRIWKTEIRPLKKK